MPIEQFKHVYTHTHTYLCKLPQQVNERALPEGVIETGMKGEGGVFGRQQSDPAGLGSGVRGQGSGGGAKCHFYQYPQYLLLQ